MNKTEDLPAMYFTVLVIMIWQGPGPVATKMPFFFFRWNLNQPQNFSVPAQEGVSFPLPIRQIGSKIASSFALEIEQLLPDFEALLAFL